MKFSVIIPTLWKSNRIFDMLETYIKADSIGEIIIIDNNKKYFEYFKQIPDKINLIQPETNIYVNPAWNHGIKISKFENICVVNDDLTFDVRVFDLLLSSNVLNNGIIGLSQTSYELKMNDNIILDEWKSGMDDWGWGCMIFLKRNMWVEIPDNIKVWFGDNFIKDVNPNPKWILKGLKVETEMSVTSDLKEFDEIKKMDQINYINYLRSIR